MRAKMNETRIIKGDLSWLSLAASVLLCVIGLLYLARPFLALSTGSSLEQYPQGYDLWTYHMASRAFYEHGADPYDNAELKKLVAGGAVRSDHPNPNYDAAALAVIGDGEMNGYLGSPVTMLVFRAFRPIGFHNLLRIWPFASLLLIIGPLMLLARRFLVRPGEAPMLKIAIYFWVVNLVIWNRAFWVHTILHGQIDVLYLAPTFFALYLILAGEQKEKLSAGNIAAAALLAAAACVKIFPGIIPAALLWIGIVRWIRTRRQGAPLLWHGNAPMQIALLTGVFAAIFTLAAALSIGLFDGAFFELIAQWRVKLSGSLYHPTLVYRQNNPHMAPFLSNYLLYLTRIWLSLWDTVGEGAVRTMSTGISVLVALAMATLIAIKRVRPRLALALSIASAPTVLMHWWNYYNTFLLAAFVILFASARAWGNSRRRIGIYAALTLSYVLMTGSYVVIGDAFPWLALFINGHELEFLRYHLTPYNLLFGYPGAFLLLVAAVVLCVWPGDSDKTI
jgi:hypothetical protein